MARPSVSVRDESAADVDAITSVTAAAFEGRPYADGTEPFIVLALRRAGALTISLIAELDGRVVGHVAFSAVSISDGSGVGPAGWYGLGPISVAPELQRQGIGTALIEEGLARLRTLGARGCILVGDPRYYERFGFRHFADLVSRAAPAEDLMAVPFGDASPQGEVHFHEAFEATADPGAKP
jgi:putative acetyltransferase